MYNSWSNPFPYTGINPYAEYLSEAQEKFKTKYNELSSIPNLASPAGEAGDVTSKALTKFAPSPTRKGETLLPGMKVGLEMKGGKEVTPTLEGTPLMEAAIKTEKEKVQPNLQVSKSPRDIEKEIASIEAQLEAGRKGTRRLTALEDTTLRGLLKNLKNKLKTSMSPLETRGILDTH